MTSTDSAPAIPEIEPTEPLFLLRGSDPLAHLLMVTWAQINFRLGHLSQDQYLKACQTAGEMELFARSHGEDVDKALHAWTGTLWEASAQLQRASSAMAGPGSQIH